MPDPQAEELDMALRTLTLVGELLQYNYFPVCVLPTQWVWNLIMLQQRPSCHLIASSSLSLNVKHLSW